MLHVARKDLREQAWPLRAYIIPDEGGAGIVRDAAWFRSARHVLVEWSESGGTYEVHAPIVEVPAPSRP